MLLMETQSKRVKIMKGLSHIKVKMRIMKTIRIMRDPPYWMAARLGVSGHVTLSCNQWRNTAFHLYVVFMQFSKVYSYVKKIFFVIHNWKSFISCCILIFWKFPCLDFDRQLFEVNNCLTVLIFVFHGKRTTF